MSVGSHCDARGGAKSMQVKSPASEQVHKQATEKENEHDTEIRVQRERQRERSRRASYKYPASF